MLAMTTHGGLISQERTKGSRSRLSYLAVNISASASIDLRLCVSD
jgi:hypothetical protein